MTDAPSTIAAQPPTIPWWNKNWKVLVVASVVIVAIHLSFGREAIPPGQGLTPP